MSKKVPASNLSYACERVRRICHVGDFINELTLIGHVHLLAF